MAPEDQRKRARRDGPPLITPVRTVLPVNGVQCVLHTTTPGQMFLATRSAILAVDPAPRDGQPPGGSLQ
jgi:hypothetical protein